MLTTTCNESLIQISRYCKLFPVSPSRYIHLESFIVWRFKIQKRRDHNRFSSLAHNERNEAYGLITMSLKSPKTI